MSLINGLTSSGNPFISREGSRPSETKAPRTEGQYRGERPSSLKESRDAGRQLLPDTPLLTSRHATMPSNPGGSPLALLAQTLAYTVHQFFGEQTIQGQISVTVPGHPPIPVKLDPQILGRIPARFTSQDLTNLTKDIQGKIDRGGQLLKDLSVNARDFKRNPATETEVADVMWYLQVRAQAKVGNFSDGSMSIPDPGNRIRDFLDSCPAYYQRLSSHIDEFQESAHGQHRGIDLYGSATNPDHLLPHSKETVLYGALNPKPGLGMPEQRLWLKLESHGCYFSSPDIGPDTDAPRERWPNKHDIGALAGHAWGALCSTVLGWFGMNSPEGTRKERIPPHMKKAYDKIVESAPQDIKALLKANNPTGKSQGLRIMRENLAEARKADELEDRLGGMRLTADEAWKEHADAFETSYLNGDVRYDHPELRFGEEIIFVQRELHASGEDRRI